MTVTDEHTGEFTFNSFASRLSSGEHLHLNGQFIDGDWQRSVAGPTFQVVSPTTEEPIATIRAATSDDVDRAVGAAFKAHNDGSWAATPLEERISVMERLCLLLEREQEHVARIQTEQMGAPITSTRVAVGRRVIANIRSNMTAASKIKFGYLNEDAEGVTLVERRPVGVVAVVLPWNAPISFEADKVSAALLAGCPVVLKAAAETPLEALGLASLLREAGLPPGLLNVVSGGGEVGQILVSHRDVARVTFTGSTMTGRSIAKICAERFARVSLELGGKSAGVLLKDADLELAATVVAGSNFGNAGQACHALTRVLVPRPQVEDFVARVREIADVMQIGDPRLAETRLGPVVSQRQRDKVEGYVTLARQAGATVAAGGGRPQHLDHGWFIEPTVLTNVTNDMRVAREEIFGPVMSVLAYETEDEAVAIANDSEYGLGGAVFSRDPDHGLDVAKRINTGTCAVNAWGMTRSAPFGGVKNSGVGREHGVWGVAACLETYAVRPAAESVDGLRSQFDGAG